MRTSIRHTIATASLLLAAACGPASSPEDSTATPLPPSATTAPLTRKPASTPTDSPTPTRPTATPVPPTLTSTAVPPTATSIPPTETPMPATHSVCARGCDFITIQAAVDGTGAVDGAIIEITDPVHTEAGIRIDEGVTVTIRGLGSELTVVQAHENPDDAADRVFSIGPETLVVLERMTVQNGRPSEDECGGGILSEGSLTLRQVVVSNSTANGGGGICSRGGESRLVVINSSIVDNTARVTVGGGLACGNGGGIRSGSGSLMLINSSVVGNTTATGRGRGGGIHIGCGGTAVFTNTTISGNSASPQSDNAVSRQQQGHGGGVNLHGDLRLTNCTIADNHAIGPGGGLYIRGRLDLVNTIIADNGGKSGNCVVSGPDAYGISGSLGKNGHSLVSDGTCDPVLTGDPLLGPLADNGGKTLTHALLPGSRAIDAIPAVSCTLPIDQRGALRPTVVTSSETPCDIGAFEVQGVD